MKNFRFLFVTVTLIFVTFSSCEKKVLVEDVTPEPGLNVTFYKIQDTDSYDYSDFLQSSITNGKVQFATFGEIGSDGLPGSFNKAYVYNKEMNAETIILFDENKEPAFIYNIDLATGKKSETINEFERIDNKQFYYRIYHYDWQNRIGTLLFETIITKNNGNYNSSPTFETENLDFGMAIKSVKLKKQNRSFSVPISRLDYYQNSNLPKNSLKSANDDLDDFQSSFDYFRNSDIADWLVKTRNIGVTTFLIGIGVSETIVGSPAGALLLIGGGSLIAVSTALEMVLTDKWTNRLSYIKENINKLVDGVANIGNDIIEFKDNYSADLQNWLNEKIDQTNTQDLLNYIKENEIITDNESLNDLPDSNGVIQIGLSWNTTDTDIDLWVIDPYGEKIYFGHEISASGGYLDRDDTDGFGPENIYWANNIPEGTYTVKVHYYGCNNEVNCPSTNYTIKVSNGLGYSKIYNGSLNAVDQVNQVVSFVVNGNQIH